MGTTIRPELSEKNPYWIERHRYYELKHFCLQYPIWKKTYEAMNGLLGRPADLASFGKMKHGGRVIVVEAAMASYAEAIVRLVLSGVVTLRNM